MLSNLNENGAGGGERRADLGATRDRSDDRGREFFQILLFRPLNFYTVSFPPHSYASSPSWVGRRGHALSGDRPPLPIFGTHKGCIDSKSSPVVF